MSCLYHVGAQVSSRILDGSEEDTPTASNKHRDVILSPSLKMAGNGMEHIGTQKIPFIKNTRKWFLSRREHYFGFPNKYCHANARVTQCSPVDVLRKTETWEFFTESWTANDVLEPLFAFQDNAWLPRDFRIIFPESLIWCPLSCASSRHTGIE